MYSKICLKMGNIGVSFTLILLGMLKAYEAYLNMCLYNQEAIAEIQDIKPN